jgi:phage terminase small subunit
MSRLTPKQQRFVVEYLVDLNATQAAIRAGYSAKTANRIASENLSKPDIQNAISKGIKERAKEVQIDAHWVLKKAVEAHQMAIGEKPVYVVVREATGDGMTVTTSQLMHKTDLAAANKALELIGKHVGIMAFEKDTQVNIGITVIDPFKPQT